MMMTMMKNPLGQVPTNQPTEAPNVFIHISIMLMTLAAVRIPRRHRFVYFQSPVPSTQSSYNVAIHTLVFKPELVLRSLPIFTRNNLSPVAWFAFQEPTENELDLRETDLFSGEKKEWYGSIGI